MKTVPNVRVFETPEGWHIGIPGGHYADEKTKTEAIHDATQLAHELNAPRIDVYNLAGELVETLPVETRSESAGRIFRKHWSGDTRLLKRTQKLRMFGTPERRF